MQHIRTDIHMHIYMHGHHTEMIKSSRWRVMIETLFQDVYNTYQKRFRLPTEPSLILGAEWILAPGHWVEKNICNILQKTMWVSCCRIEAGNPWDPRSIEDVLQRLRAIFGGLQSAHVGMAGLPDGLRFGQGWARCPTSRLGVGEFGT